MPANPYIAHGYLHTIELQERGVPLQNDIMAVETFAYRVSQIGEEDYGDWMRRTNVYLHELERELEVTPLEVREAFQEMEHFVQYNPDWNIPRTAHRVIEMALLIRRMLGAPDNLSLEDFDIAPCDDV